VVLNLHLFGYLYGNWQTHTHTYISMKQTPEITTKITVNFPGTVDVCMCVCVCLCVDGGTATCTTSNRKVLHYDANMKNTWNGGLRATNRRDITAYRKNLSAAMCKVNQANKGLCVWSEPWTNFNLNFISALLTCAEFMVTVIVNTRYDLWAGEFWIILWKDYLKGRM
jgi:hypothetical protein